MASTATPGDPALRVFIADDSKPVSDMLTELLTEQGRIEVIGVGDSEGTAIEGIRRLKPDVVVLDLQLKTGSGTNVIRAVRSDPALASTKLLVTSNHVSAQMRAGCMELGADDYFDKVKELGALTTKLAQLAQGRIRSGS
jgi:two-component system, NarL family, response regulator DevR